MSKRAIVANLITKTRSSYWFLPTVLALTACLASQLSLYLDRNHSSVLYLWPASWETTQVEGARSTLSVIAQSILGVAGVMFSVTIVAVSFASGNFGPRLIGNFMRDRGTQWSLGILISTFVFALLVLRAVQGVPNESDGSTEAFVPHMSLSIAIGLAAVSIMTVIFYVHHIPETINVSNISAGLGKRLRGAVEDAIDKEIEDEADERPKRDPDRTVNLDGNGYIQTFDVSRLVELAKKHDCHMRIVQGGGEFVNPYTPVLDIWSNEELSDEVLDELRGCFVIGQMPTERQNTLFIVQQLVEMIARALSPGVNDPYTAINCLNWLYSGLATAANYKGGLPEPTYKRVEFQPLTFERLFNHGIANSLPYCETDVLTLQHLKIMLKRLEDEITERKHKKIVSDFLKSLKKE
ncbi:Uncharacterized membrane protein [Cognatiyoonia koreensis]|uniref:Uncharacterized membrane protein n=1 Tax=Cognatiyoonia koreensis TaxID=364200 RepID=A0A1I0PYC6_9RHOB|nr:DUF2254 domain-containing protein [Cognatiyoonia koreensis]SEW19423.1 Uncharacterized membrane protein [Cognatiyoonia koreensis]